MENSKHTIEYYLADSRHVDQMHEIEEMTFSVPWSYKSLFDDVCNHDISLYIVGMCGDELISYAGLWYVMEESHITNIAVKESFRRRGIGVEMMNRLFDAAGKLHVKTMTLEVRESNTAAISLYEKIGFIKEGRRKGYYADNYEDALIMNITL